MSTLEYHFQPALYVKVSGPLDAQSYDDFSNDIIERIEESDESSIIMDLINLNTINSLGLGAIIRIWKKTSDSGKTLQILANQKICHVFRVARLYQIIDIRVIEPLST